MSSLARSTLSIWIFVLALLFTACSESEPDASPAFPEIVSFLAEPDAVEAGATATLRWETRDATRVAVLDSLGAPLGAGTLEPSGALEVTPIGTSTYVLEAVNAAGKTIRAEATVRVQPLPDVPVIESFTVDPPAAPTGSEITLAWRTTGADEIRITEASGAPVHLGDASPGEGSVRMRMGSDAVWTLTATNRGGEATARASLDTVPAPQVSLDGPDMPVLPGASATIRWTSSDAQRVVITAADGSVLVDSADELQGSRTVTASVSTRYTITATGIGGAAEAAVEIAVLPVIERFAITTPGPVRSGDTVEVTWAMRGATAGRIAAVGGSHVDIPAAELQSGTASVEVGPDGAVELQATSGTLRTTALASIAITQAPRVHTFAAHAAEVSARPDLPAIVRLEYFVDAASRLQLFAEPGGQIDIGATSLRSGTYEVPIIEATTFRLVATNEFGLVEATVHVGVVPAPRIESFGALPARVGAGEPVPLSWSVSNAATIRIERDGVDIGVDPLLTSGTVDDLIAADATYVLRAFDRLGYEVVSDPLLVTVGDPIIGSFTVDRPTIPAGQLLTFSWANLGGRSLELRDGDGAVIFSTSSLAEIAEGSAESLAPIVDDTLTYSLHVTNGAGATSVALLPVTIIAGPFVREFTADTDAVTLGGAVTFSWRVDDDALGRAPMLTLTDDVGNAYDVTSADPNVGTIAVTPVEAGATSFTLVAGTPDTTSSSASVPVIVYGLPQIDLAQATPAIVDTQGGTLPATSTLSWATRHGVQLDVFRLDDRARPITPPIHSTVVLADIEAGSVQLTPAPGPSSYRVRVTNGAGATATADVNVRVDPAQIHAFTADPLEIVRGRSSHLSWVTERATTIELTPETPSIQVGTTPFIDISSSPTARMLTPSNADTGNAEVIFPAGFTFSWYGAPKTALYVTVDGFVSFDPNASGRLFNSVMPTGSVSPAHIAPYFEDLQLGPNGSLWWDDGTDAEGPYLAVMWKNVQFAVANLNPASMTFEVLLRPDGRFEYRYGPMTATQVDLAAGLSATIGFQNETGTAGYSYSFNSVVYGRLPGRSIAFDPTPEPGTRDVAPTVDTTYRLTVTNAHSTEMRELTVRVHLPVSVSASIAPAELQAGMPFTVAWEAENAVEVRVLDGSGAVRCVAAGDQIADGSCEITEPVSGPQTYTVRAVGSLATDVATVTLPVDVLGPFTLTAASNSLAVGQSTTLSWVTDGVTNLALTAGGQPVDLTGTNPLADTITITPTITTEYVLTGTDVATGIIRGATQTVTVRNAAVTSFTVSENQVPPSSPITLTWTSFGGAGAYVSGVMPATPVIDVSASSPFIDISTSPTAVTLPLSSNNGFADFTFPADLQFPYFGQYLDRFRVFASGYISFNQEAASNAFNGTLPNSSNLTATMVHLAPFWDSLNRMTTGSILVDDRSDAEGRFLVVQWNDFQFGSSTSNPTELDFQVLLRDNGVFEFRYGTMTSVRQDLADGASATIGFQNVFGSAGYTVRQNASATPLGNTSLRFDLRMPASGSTVVVPTESTTYTVCNLNRGYQECSEQVVVVVKPGDVMFSELMITPAGGAAEWVEVRNTTPYPIDISGFTLTSGAEASVISPGVPLVVEPGEFAVFSGPGGPADTAWDYGSALTLNDTQDQVGLLYGTAQMDQVAWDSAAGWSPTSGVSLTLEPSKFRRDPAANDAASAWCTIALGTYDGVNQGTPGTLGSGGCLSQAYTLDPASNAEFIDISAASNQIVWHRVATSSLYGQVPGGIGFDFPFFDGTVALGTPVGLNLNGYLSFVQMNSTSSNANMPSSSSPNPVIAPFWDVHNAQTLTAAHAEDLLIGGRRVLVVQWNNVFVTGGGAGRATFQAQLWEDGDIVFAYRELEGGDRQRASSGTIGIENGTGTDAVLYSYNTESIWPHQSIYLRKR